MSPFHDEPQFFVVRRSRPGVYPCRQRDFAVAIARAYKSFGFWRIKSLKGDRA